MPFYKNSFFHVLKTSTSVVNEPNFGRSNIAMDLFREKSSIVIDGEPLSASYYDQFNQSKEVAVAAVQSFFSEVLLKQLPKEHKANALWYLTKTFHQGGILFPAAGGIAKAMVATGVPYFGRGEFPREDAIFITTSAHGFKIQNIHKQNLFTEIDSDNRTIVGAEVILDIDFTQLSSRSFLEKSKQIDELNRQIGIQKSGIETLRHERDQLGTELSAKIIRIEKNNIYTHDPKLKKFLQKNRFLDAIIDFIKSLFGVNGGKEISSICRNGEEVYDSLMTQKTQSTKSVASSDSDSDTSLRTTPTTLEPKSSSSASLEDVSVEVSTDPGLESGSSSFSPR